MQHIATFLKRQTLPLAMLTGVAGYFLYVDIPILDGTHAWVAHLISIVQPLLIFAMLFLTFCKIRPSDLRLCRWQVWLLFFQGGLFVLGALLLHGMPATPWRIVAESGLLCIICPTATAASVVTQKLGGDAGSLTTYTILVNLMVALLVPAFVPFIHPASHTDFYHAFLAIVSKVFPLLFGPFLLATLLRRMCPKWVEWFCRFRDLSFYLWAIALSLAIGVTVRSIIHTSCPWQYQIGIAVVSLLTCILQFAFGHYVGKEYCDTISATQACGQKNTVFAIWMGYTFMTPITSIAGGFYSVWHNLWNSWQLSAQRQSSPTDTSASVHDDKQSGN